MKAVILCAGYATRLYPLTLNRPKALLEIKGRPILDHIIAKIEEVGCIDEVFVVTNSKFYDHFLEWKNSRNLKKKIFILNDMTFSNEDRLGGIGDLNFAISSRKIDDDILVVLGDNYFESNLNDAVEFFKKRNECVLAIKDLGSLEDAKKFGVVKAENGKIVSFEEKPQNPDSSFISTGIYIFPRKSLISIKDYMKTDLPKDGLGFLIHHFLKSQDVFAFPLEGFWHDIGDVKTYEMLK